MKGFGLWILFLLVGAALICFCFSNKPTTNTYSVLSGRGIRGSENHVSVKATNRKLKEKSYTGSSYMNEAASIHLADYRPIDPVPSSKASIRPGPIQHGTPLMPFIPMLSPPPPAPAPGLPKSDGSP